MNTNSELVMDLRLPWDTRDLNQVDEAKARIKEFVRKGYEVITATGEQLVHFKNLGEVIVKAHPIIGKRILKILCEKGDERIIWNKDNGMEAKQAKVRFMEQLAKGFKAYSVDAEGKKNRKITEFDIDAEEILMVPATVAG